MKKYALALILTLLATGVFAGQSYSVKPDGFIRLKVSLTGVIRISVKDDRIRRLVNDDSAFGMVNDAETGDVFLRFQGEESFGAETGFIITEKGVTINYELRRSSTATESILITVKGGPSPAREAETGFVSAPPDFGTSDSYTGDLAQFIRSVILKKIGNRPAPKMKSESVISTMRAGRLRARVLVARAGRNGAQISHQSYFRSRVVAVWVDTPVLAPGGVTWVIVVEAN